jgi:hypothetical protein
MVLVCCSAPNADRHVTLFRAAERSGRTLVVDLYAAARAVLRVVSAGRQPAATAASAAAGSRAGARRGRRTVAATASAAITRLAATAMARW